jgi:hypothetical protein
LGGRFINASGALRGEVVNVCLESRCRHSSCPASLPLAYDPGIHQSSQDHFSKKMDCRVEPGNDGSAIEALLAV